MLRKIAGYIERYHLFDEDSKIIVAVSGGADSVALLHILMKLNYNCEVVHCNFHLRGEESMRDERFVRKLCDRLDVGLTVADFDTEKYAARNGISIEMAAREQRYSFFEKTRVANGAAAIAVAHHRDDVAETVLLNLIRGTGIRGLHGIRPKNGFVVRPLLKIGRDEIIEYLYSIGETYITDSTNLKSDYTRNKIRLELIPLMREINPSVCSALSESSDRIAEAEKVYLRGICEGKKRVMHGNAIDTVALLQEASPRSLLHEILYPLGFNTAQTEEIFRNIDGESGKEYISNTHRVVKDRNRLVVLQADDCDCGIVEQELPAAGCISLRYGTLTIEECMFDGTIDKDVNVASMDSSKLKRPLFIRNVRVGDRFIPFGMKGSKLVSDYLTDKKKSVDEKRKQLVVTDADGKIAWVIGERLAAPFGITANTENIVRFIWKKSDSDECL